jgi:hypothetical protein
MWEHALFQPDFVNGLKENGRASPDFFLLVPVIEPAITVPPVNAKASETRFGPSGDKRDLIWQCEAIGTGNIKAAPSGGFDPPGDRTGNKQLNYSG